MCIYMALFPTQIYPNSLLFFLCIKCNSSPHIFGIHIQIAKATSDMDYSDIARHPDWSIDVPLWHWYVTISSVCLCSSSHALSWACVHCQHPKTHSHFTWAGSYWWGKVERCILKTPVLTIKLQLQDWGCREWGCAVDRGEAGRRLSVSGVGEGQWENCKRLAEVAQLVSPLHWQMALKHFSQFCPRPIWFCSKGAAILPSPPSVTHPAIRGGRHVHPPGKDGGIHFQNRAATHHNWGYWNVLKIQRSPSTHSISAVHPVAQGRELSTAWPFHWSPKAGCCLEYATQKLTFKV